jgi:coenzyme F420-dependent glucose-6-phosphate dehydrogenase
MGRSLPTKEEATMPRSTTPRPSIPGRAPSPASPRFGFTLSSEEHEPRELVACAGAAEDAGFDFLSISDHFHPWIDQQGHSAFVWGVIGAISAATRSIGVGTGVTCPTTRIHPAIAAHAAATAGCLLPGRFVFGVGAGEKLNEHITGARWPEQEVRAEQLEEAIAVIRALWRGDVTSHHGRWYTVENARIYDVPDPLPPIVVSAGGPRTAALAARVGDGLWMSSVKRETVEAWREAGGSGPVYAQIDVCYGPDERAAIELAHRQWPTGGIGQASQELPSPAHFEELARRVRPEDVAEQILCGPDVGRIVEEARGALDVGVTHVYLHQVGPDQAAFLDMAGQELLPRLRELEAAPEGRAERRT